jgi:hypothetical protein
MAKKQPTGSKYTAVRQLIYPDAKSGEEIIVEPGGEVTSISASSLALEIEAGNIVESTEEQ